MYEIPTAIVVDDNQFTINVLCDYLDMIGVEVVGRGKNGKDAVDLYKKYRPDIVFLDLLMPQYDGFFALEQIRKKSPLAAVIIVTSDLSQESAVKLEKLRPTKIIYKPFAVDAIAQIVDAIRRSKPI